MLCDRVYSANQKRRDIQPDISSLNLEALSGHGEVTSHARVGKSVPCRLDRLVSVVSDNLIDPA